LLNVIEARTTETGRFNTRTAILVAGASACALAAWSLLSGGRPDRLSLYSKALGETRQILVRLPEGYDQAKTPCPLIVLLDGGDRKQYSADRPLYSRSSDVLASLEKEGFPPMILVGIDNRNRVRDMTPVERPDIYVGGGGAEAFMGFIETEVVPYVESRWRVNATRILYGESYGGLFVLDALARGRQTFTDYIAVSPAVGVWPTELAASFRRRFERPSAVRSLYIVYGGRDAPLVTEYTAPFAREIERVLPAGFRLRMDVLPGEGHTPASSLERGLRFVFERGLRR
jgi:predicted alpha/beta superfamily hydrolase